MPSTLIIACNKCGGLLLAKSEQNTKTCSYCGNKVTIQKSRKIASAENAYKASEILKKLKTDHAEKHANPKRPQQ